MSVRDVGAGLFAVFLSVRQILVVSQLDEGMLCSVQLRGT